MPRLLWLMVHVPISSPQMTRMFGFFAAGCCADAALHPKVTPTATPAANRARAIDLAQCSISTILRLK
jgi:hypothetical protein